MERKITFDITRVIAKDLDGQVIQVNGAKTVGNTIYCKATTLEWDTIARAIYAGKKIELTKQELDMLMILLLAPDTPIYLYFKKALKDYFDTLNKTYNEQANNSKQKN
jgi:hypothetical protein